MRSRGVPFRLVTGQNMRCFPVFATILGLLSPLPVLAQEPASAGTINLPAAATAGRGYRITIKNLSSPVVPITISPNGFEVIDGQSSLIINDRFVSYSLLTEGNNWYIESSHDTNASNDFCS